MIFSPKFLKQLENWLEKQEVAPYKQMFWDIPKIVRNAYILDFFIKEKKVFVEVYSNHSGWGWIITKTNGTTIKEIEDYKFYETYDKALEVGLYIASETVA